MFTDEQEFLNFMDAHGFTYQRLEHPAVFTCAEAEAQRPNHPAVSTKNLFLCDKKARRFFLAVTACEKTVQLDTLARQFGVSTLRFASADNLKRYLGVTPGAVTMMGLANDTGNIVELWIDDGIWNNEFFLSHPLVNTATLVLARSELERFLAMTGHAIHLFHKERRP